MAGAFIGGAALGAGFGSALDFLCDAVRNAVGNALTFKSNLESLQSRLDSLNKLVEQTKDLNEVLSLEEDATKEFIKLMEEGKKLVGKCLEIGECNPQKSVYGADLSKSLQEIQKSIGFFLPLLQTKNGFENRTMIRNNTAVIRNIESIVNRIELGNLARDLRTTVISKLSCAVPPPPRCPVGLDVHTAQLKGHLLNEKVRMLAISAPGGCGKTTLVKKLCQDQDIKGKYRENIFFVQVSETPILEAILSRLSGHMGHLLPRFQGEEDRVNYLGALFQQIEGPTLLILDDVWSELPSFQGEESFLDKFSFDIPQCQILVTSRNVIEGNRFKKYPLSPLNDRDAETLLHDWAEWKDESWKDKSWKDKSSPIPEEHMKKILQYCGGYPLSP